MEEIRLQKFLADIGIASRRKCEELILQEKVKVNGEVAKLGMKVNPDVDNIEYNGKQMKNEQKEYVYILLNKPIDYVTTVKDQFNRKTVLDLVKIKNTRLVPVGRLDMYTSGAIILSNDGDFVYKITHPKHEIKKTYNVAVIGKVTNEEIEILANGVDIGDFVTSKAEIKTLKYDEQKNTTRLQITIHEGKNRQIRRMCEAINKRVLSLHRSKIGDISVKDLKLGTWRYLKKNEIEKILKNCIEK